MRSGTRARPRRAGAIRAVVVAVCCVIGLSAAPAAAAPTAGAAPAADPADILAARVVQLRAELAAPQAAVEQARALAAIALDDYQAEQAARDAARTEVDRAAAAVGQAADRLTAARAAFLSFVRRSYMSGSTSPAAVAFLTADPAGYVQRQVLLHSAGAYRSDELVRYADAQQDADRAQAAAGTALDRATGLEREAATALATARDAEQAARAQARAVAGSQGDVQSRLDQAHAQLVGLVGESEAAQRIAIAEAAAAAAATGSAPAGPVAVLRAAGPADPAAVAAAIAAARGRLGAPYAWGGGGSLGPGYGIDPDAGVIGFDCSGLTQYAYAQAGVAIPRNSRAQYSLLPKVARDQLQAGDLVFWAVDVRNWQTIHHVALYLGDGTVLQAPESGDVVKISPMWWDGYLGAVRPTG